jgi:aspartyl-tRNA(Asn)/glutamyl-tRNA(Gln) amidotransferase subunit C
MPGHRDDFDVARVAALARLRLTPEETALYRTQLASILALAREVIAADTPHLEAVPLAALAPVERVDRAAPSLAADVALANAPRLADNLPLVRVPTVIE